jgi:hypothetical protein
LLPVKGITDKCEVHPMLVIDSIISECPRELSLSGPVR